VHSSGTERRTGEVLKVPRLVPPGTSKWPRTSGQPSGAWSAWKKKEEELGGLSILLFFDQSHFRGSPLWYKRPKALAVLLPVLALILDIIFW
jgi:hypothetical protein